MGVVSGEMVIWGEGMLLTISTPAEAGGVLKFECSSAPAEAGVSCRGDGEEAAPAEADVAIASELPSGTEIVDLSFFRRGWELPDSSPV